MTKGEAVAQIAGKVAGWLEASDLDDLFGDTAADLSDRDAQRLEDAKGEVVGRLFRMGRQKT